VPGMTSRRETPSLPPALCIRAVERVRIVAPAS
jgi:hypothetical protein